MSNIFKLIKESIDLIIQENCEIAFKLYIYCSSLVNKITLEKEKFSEDCLSFINKAFDLLESAPKLNKLSLIKYLTSNIVNLIILDNKQKNKLIDNLIKLEEITQNREEQFKIALILSKLYYQLYKDGKKISECLIKARRYADFDMTLNKNVCLYVDLINIMIYYIEKEDDIVEIKKEQIEDLIELIKGHINTIKLSNEDKDKNSINEAENYFINTINFLQNRKSHKNSNLKEFYQKISI